MLNSLVRFASCCRAYGLMVSPGEVLDCARSLERIEIKNESLFKTVVRAHFVKSVRYRDRFEEVYGLFFFRHPNNFQEPMAAEELNQALALDAEISRTEKESPSRALLDFLQGNPEPFLARIQALHTQEDDRPRPFKSNLGQLSAKLGVMLLINRLRQQILRFPETGADTHGIRAVKQDYLNRLDRAVAILSREPATQNISLRQDRGSPVDPNRIQEIPFSSLSGKDLEQARILMDRLVRKLKDKAGRRSKARNQGNIDVKKTLGRANRFQGIPLEIRYKKKSPAKARILVLCDVSGSVWSTARFMLQLLYALEECFSQIKSFIFVAELADISDRFKDPDIDRAVAGILKDPGINLSERTDYGSVFRDFLHRHESDLNRNTTLIILGDGRSNYYNPRAHILEQIREKCRRIIWLIPEPAHLWGTGDSEIHTYKVHCHEVRTCLNLRHLTDFVQELAL